MCVGGGGAEAGSFQSLLSLPLSFSLSTSLSVLSLPFFSHSLFSIPPPSLSLSLSRSLSLSLSIYISISLSLLCSLAFTFCLNIRQSHFICFLTCLSLLSFSLNLYTPLITFSSPLLFSSVFALNTPIKFFTPT